MELVQSREPWQCTRAELVPYKQTFPVSHLHDAGPCSYREADLHEYAVYRRLCETIPPDVPSFPVGTWSLDRFDCLWQFRCYSIKALIFPGGDPYATSWGWN